MKKSVLLLVLFASYSQAEDSSNPQYLGISNARSMIPKVHAAYLQCYPLHAPAKDECLNQLVLKYISAKQRSQPEYVQAFQFKAEKLGFKNFLNDLKLPCERVDNGPEFMKDNRAYLVKCTPNHQYHMQFEYKDKKWIIPKETTKR